MTTTLDPTREQRDMRIAIARDVIKQLDAKALNVMTGSYIYGDFDAPLDLSRDLSEVVDLVQAKWRVCALGACILSKARLYDAVRLSDIVDDNDSGLESATSLSAGGYEIEVALQDIFGMHQTGLIESAFERTPMSNTPDHDTVYQAVDFGKEWDSSEDRLRAIMLNIVRNDGEFIPGDTASQEPH